LLLIVALLSAQGSALPKQDINYVVGPADVLRITVFSEPQLSGAFRIDNDGEFSYPFLGRVKASGLSVAGVASAVRDGLAKGYLRDPQVTVEVEVFRSQSVFVMGEVRTPGKYILSGSLTLLDVLVQAGSLNSEAGDEVLVLRPKVASTTAPALPEQRDAEVTRISLRDIASGKMSRNVSIRDGDTVFVPKVEHVFVIGLVRSAGAYPYEANMTVLRAIATAGGITERGSNRRLRIVRIVGGKRKEFEAKPTDIVQPGDTIVVRQRLL
jgi:polysaccharide export outer membrane protein